ncbi:hypothetical protein [Lysinibacillus sphaericus]|uniref:hypothetical protein n=1 Tax=Lysinibacillus sphaericus TaxID=1421 RepID=UPI001A9DA51F|nr:hypothetical protein [Lysinibacillus sphaericus]QTB27606.1 hypothetical protein J2D51_02795 [Lysinibacillus sphaericus]
MVNNIRIYLYGVLISWILSLLMYQSKSNSSFYLEEIISLLIIVPVVILISRDIKMTIDNANSKKEAIILFIIGILLGTYSSIVMFEPNYTGFVSWFN